MTGVAPEVVAPLAVLEGTLDDPERTARVVELTTAMLNARGYARAAITVARGSSCGVELAVAVTLGPRYRITRIDLETPDDFPEPVRRSVLGASVGTYNVVGGIYREDYLANAMRRLEAEYSERGWVNAEAGEPRVSIDHARAEIDIVLPIKAGPRFKIRNLTVRGADASGDAALAMLGIHTGDWYEAPRLRSAMDRARRRIGHKVELWPALDGDHGEVDLEVEVQR